MCFEKSLSDFMDSFSDSFDRELKKRLIRVKSKGMENCERCDKVKIIEKGRICFNFEAENCLLDNDMMKSAKIKARMNISVEIEFSRLIARVSTK